MIPWQLGMMTRRRYWIRPSLGSQRGGQPRVLLVACAVPRAELHAGPAIVVIGLEDKVRAAPTDVFEQLYRLGFKRGFYIAQQAGPGHVSLDQLALGWRKEFAIALVGQHREKGLLVRNLATQAVGDAHGARLVGADQRGAFGGPRNDVVDQHAAINEVNLAALRGQCPAVELELARIADQSGYAQFFKPRLDNFKFAPGGHLAPIHDGDHGSGGRDAPPPGTAQHRV